MGHPLWLLPLVKALGQPLEVLGILHWDQDQQYLEQQQDQMLLDLVQLHLDLLLAVEALELDHQALVLGCHLEGLEEVSQGLNSSLELGVMVEVLPLERLR